MLSGNSFQTLLTLLGNSLRAKTDLGHCTDSCYHYNNKIFLELKVPFFGICLKQNNVQNNYRAHIPKQVKNKEITIDLIIACI